MRFHHFVYYIPTRLDMVDTEMLRYEIVASVLEEKNKIQQGLYLTDLLFLGGVKTTDPFPLCWENS